MKILSAEQIKSADEYTIQNEAINSIELMERAALQCVDWIVDRFDTSSVFKVFCGVGNNGGDGLVISRHLISKGYNVSVSIVRFSENCSVDFLKNMNRLYSEAIEVFNIDTVNIYETEISKNDIVIDAILGAGLNRPVEGLIAESIKLINKSGSTVISIDSPSGLFCQNNSSNNYDNIVKANYTLTFQVPRLSFLFSENSPYVGKWQVLDIGLDNSFINSIHSKYNYLTIDIIKSIYRKRKQFSHKGNFGHALLVAGSKGKNGAAILASKACLRAGAGLLTVHVVACANEILQIAIPEAMVNVDSSSDFISDIPDITKFSSIGIGPGIGTDKITANVLKQIIQNTGVPLVIDADGINILSENKTWLSFLPEETIITPHPKEFEKLFGKSNNSFHRMEIAREQAIRYKIFIVLKGAHTLIATPGGNLYFNSTGNPGMATAGSGDVLTGIITGLFAQGYSPLESSILGVFLHGLAGDIASNKFSEEAMIAGDIINSLGNAFLAIKDAN